MLEHLLVGLVLVLVAAGIYLLIQAHQNHVSAQAQLKTDLAEAHNRINLFETQVSNEFRHVKNTVQTALGKPPSGPSVTASGADKIKVDGAEIISPVSTSAGSAPQARQS